MGSEVPEYFLARNWDYPPGGPIRVGNVITSLKKPHRPLAWLVPDAEARESFDSFNSSKFNVTIEDKKEKHGGLSILTTWLSGLLGLGVDVDTDIERSSDRFFTFKRVDTHGFTPTDRFNQRCVETAAVRRFLERSWFQKRVFVITGIKEVSGAQGSTSKSRSTELSTGVQVDGTILSGGVVPVGGGPEIRGGRARRSRVSWEGSSDFVLAFRVSKIVVDGEGNFKKEDEYLRGAELGLEDDAPKKEPEHLTATTSDRPTDTEGFEPVVVVEGNDPVHYGVPEESDEEDEDEE